VKKIYIARDPTDAGLIRGMLESYGIAVEVRGEALWGARGLIPITADTAPSIWVREDDADKARALIDAKDPTVTLVREAWTCDRCGEDVDPELYECWACGSSGAV
jgi:hypothetical protein